jgi:hypothetical protein
VLEAMPQDFPKPIAPPVLAEGIIKPLETRYAGHRFRSRLEARWAVFFDHLSIEWQYEPEAYRIAGKGYLPDFWLPGLQIWAEVKGVLDAPTLQHLTRAADPRNGLPASPAGEAWKPSSRTGRILLLGQPPLTNREGWLHSRIDFDHGQPTCQPVAFASAGLPVALHPVGDSDPLFDEFGECSLDTASGREAALTGSPSPLLRPEEEVTRAYRAARMARFEHGESGAPQEVHDGAVAPRRVRRKRTPAPVDSTQDGPAALSAWPLEMAPQPELMPMPKRRVPKPRKVSPKSVELTYTADLRAPDSHLTSCLPSASS